MSALDKVGVISLCKKIAHEEAELLKEKLEQAVKVSNNVIIATHFPPWLEVSKHRGNTTDFNALPYYASKIIGDVIKDFAEQHPMKNFRTFSGHTHSAANVKMTSNILATVGSAEYSHPSLCQIIEL